VALVASLFAFAASVVLGADTGYKQIRIEAVDGTIQVRLPLTDVTGKVRPKEQTADGEGEPIAPTKTRMAEKHYLEWQISYDSRDPAAPNVVKEVSFTRRGETKYGVELTKMLVEALRIGLISTNDLFRERDRLAKLADVTLEEREGIKVEKEPAKQDGKPLPDGFQRWTQKVPRFVRETDSGFIQIQLKPRQRAVGVQAMVYVCLPLDKARTMDGSPRAPGPARTKETVLFVFDRTNTGFLLDVVRAFGMASKQHNEDMTAILGKVVENATTTRKTQ